MRKIILCLSIIVVFSCSNKDADNDYVNQNLLGKWKLIEIQQAPGNGDVGTYQTVESEGTLEFFKNGTYKSNANSCYLGNSIGEYHSGKFNSVKNLLKPAQKCDFDEWSGEIKFTIQNSILLVFNSSCIEGCGLKYQKID